MECVVGGWRILWDIFLMMDDDGAKASMKIYDAKHQPIANCRPMPPPLSRAGLMLNSNEFKYYSVISAGLSACTAKPPLSGSIILAP